VVLHRMAGGDCDVAEEAKAHLARGFGMMTGWACRYESVSSLAHHYPIHRRYGPPDGAASRLNRAKGHMRILIKRHCAGGGFGGDDLVDIALGMAELDLFVTGQRAFVALQICELRCVETGTDAL